MNEATSLESAFGATLDLGDGTLCGLRITNALTLGALGLEQDGYLPWFIGRRHEFFSCVTSLCHGAVIFDYRLVTTPNPSSPGEGRIEAYLLVKAVKRPTSSPPANLPQQLLRLSQTLLLDYDVALLDGEELRQALQPCPIRRVVQFRRQAVLQNLFTAMTRDPQPGFDLATDAVLNTFGPANAEGITVFPAIAPTGSAIHNALHLLLLEEGPAVVSFRFAPTTLSMDEDAYLAVQIARCQVVGDHQPRSGGVRPSAHDAPGGARPEAARALALRDLSQGLKQHLLQRLQRLRAGCVEFSIQVAAAHEPSQALVAALGYALNTHPGGSGTSREPEPPVWQTSAALEAVWLSDADGTRSGIKGLVLPEPADDGPANVPRRLKCLADREESSALLRLPPARVEPVIGISARTYRYRSAPASISAAGLPLGINRHLGHERTAFLAPEDRLRHVYIVGQTGTGKTTMMRRMILHDIDAGHGMAVLDPHGDLFRSVLGQIPAHRRDDVVVIDPTDEEYPVGLNLLEFRDPSQRQFIAQEMAGIIQRLIVDEHGSAAYEWMGPAFFQHMRMNLLLVTSDPDRPGTLDDFYRVFMEPDYWKTWLPLKLSDPQLETWVKGTLQKTDYLRSGESISVGAWITCKFEQFLFDPRLRNIFIQPRSTIDFRSLMDDGKVILVNLAKGELSEMLGRFFGMILLAKIQSAAMGRSAIPQEDRRPFFVYVDEFQTMATANFISLLSEGRKFGLGLVLANQFVSQLEQSRITDAIFGNAGTLVSFRVGQRDGETLERILAPEFRRHDLTRLPNWFAAVSTLSHGQTVPPFSLETSLSHTDRDPAVMADVGERSRARYARRTGEPKPEPEPEPQPQPETTPETQPETAPSADPGPGEEIAKIVHSKPDPPKESGAL